MMHEPAHRAEWENLSPCSAWLKTMPRHHFYAKVRTAVPARSATNSRPLRPSDPLYDPENAEFLAFSVSRGILKRRRTPCHVTNSISLVDKPPGSTDRWRIVGNMAHLKDNFPKEGFKAETIADLPNILAPDMFMFKLDLTAGVLQHARPTLHEPILWLHVRGSAHRGSRRTIRLPVQRPLDAQADSHPLRPLPSARHGRHHVPRRQTVRKARLCAHRPPTQRRRPARRTARLPLQLQVAPAASPLHRFPLVSPPT